jgi:hypothetical protein
MICKMLQHIGSVYAINMCMYVYIYIGIYIYVHKCYVYIYIHILIKVDIGQFLPQPGLCLLN